VLTPGTSGVHRIRLIDRNGGAAEVPLHSVRVLFGSGPPDRPSPNRTGRLRRDRFSSPFLGRHVPQGLGELPAMTG